MQFAVALACGNTVVAKLSKKVPSSFRLIAYLMHQAGLPVGILNVVNGDSEVVDRMIEHAMVGGFNLYGKYANH